MRREAWDMFEKGDWIAAPIPEKGVDPVLWTWRRGYYAGLNWNKRYPRLTFPAGGGAFSHTETYKFPSMIVAFDDAQEAERYVNERNRIRNACKKARRIAMIDMGSEVRELDRVSYGWSPLK